MRFIIIEIYKNYQKNQSSYCGQKMFITSISAEKNEFNIKLTLRILQVTHSGFP